LQKKCVISNKLTVAFITARGGSKGLPGKNISDLGGKPLLAYTVEVALASKSINRYLVSTDYEDIAEASRNAGSEVPFIRPESLGTDTAHSPEVVEHAIDFIEKTEGVTVNIAMMLQPTSPFRTGKHLMKP